MRRVFVLLVLLLLVGCSDNNKSELNVLNWSSYIPDEVIYDFEEKYNVDVNYSTYSSNEELLAKVTSAKEGTYDLIFPSDYMVEIMKDKKMLEIIDQNKLKNVSNLDSKYLNLDFDKGNFYSLPFLAATTLIAYNTEVIKENITSYNDLLNPKYKGEIVLLDDQRIIIGASLMALGYDMNETSDEALEKAKQWLLNLTDNVKLFDSDSPKSFLITKEVSIGLIWNAEAAIAMKENPNIKVVYPEEGFNLSVDNYAILKGAKNIDNAYLFIDYLLEEDVMKKVIESYPYCNVNKKTNQILDNTYLSNEASNISTYNFNRATLVKNIGTSIKKYDKIWAEIK